MDSSGDARQGAAAIAIVMPVYNRAGVVGRAVASVLAQDFPYFELIVVDDGSTDGTAAAVEAFADPRVRLIRRATNVGGNAARNLGITAAAAPLVAFLDSDDAFLPHKLRYLAGYFEARPEIEALIDSFEIRYPPSMGKRDVACVNPVLDDNGEIERAIFARRLFKATPAIAVRRAAALRAGLFDETLRRRQDFDFVLRLLRTARCATTDARLWVKSWSPDAVSAKQSTFLQATLELCDRHPRYLVEPAFRTGLARDVARHFWRLASRGSLSAAMSDARRLHGAVGSRAAFVLVAEGFGELARRGVERALR